MGVKWLRDASKPFGLLSATLERPRLLARTPITPAGPGFPLEAPSKLNLIMTDGRMEPIRYPSLHNQGTRHACHPLKQNVIQININKLKILEMMMSRQ